MRVNHLQVLSAGNLNLINMPRTLYSPRLSDDVVRSLYREGRRRRMPMTRLADLLLREALGTASNTFTLLADPCPTGTAGKAFA